MEIYIGKDDQVLGPYREAEIQVRLDEGIYDGDELAWQEGQEAWVNVKELLEGADAPAPWPEEPSVEPESTQAPEPLDEETLGQINKIKELISDGHADTAWQLVQSLNNPRIYEGLLEDCPIDDQGWVRAPEYLSENGDLFIKLLVHMPQEAKSVSKLYLDGNQISDATPLKDLPQLTELYLRPPMFSDVTHALESLKDLPQLTTLHLRGSLSHHILDVTPLKDLTQLTQLNLSYTRISDVTPLKDLTQLTKLIPSNNQISDVTPLKDLTQLTTLWLGINQISDVTPLKDLTQLTTLYLEDNQISESDIEDLQKALPECKM